ncbi:AAA family ATPase [Calycomorphotria hydatis]|uniref:Uncharacterized AAA domain-containing protein ycf46 n=1 Tax=Calycomorphotria hydatis TaxID=2528027 RepID=A0A517T582_9PLAN|nr:AAA family ATPase [Calycomorphotria hydatis]QDT63530.1 ATP-dependent zinc metalloprotease FtsH 3 [Calycomorphotria hydatis]
MDQLRLLIRSGHPAISIETTNEEGAERKISAEAEVLNIPLFKWSVTDGLREFWGPESPGPAIVGGRKPIKFILHLLKVNKPGIYVLFDAGAYLKEAFFYRGLRDVIRQSASTGVRLIFVDPLPLPPEFRSFTVRYDLPSPEVDELRALIKETFQNIKNEEPHKNYSAQLTSAQIDRIALTLRGLGRAEATRVISTAIYDDNKFNSEDINRIVEAKRMLLGTTGCLESIAADFSPEDIGGLSNLKKWLAKRRDAFSKEAAEFGIETPRGVLMLGVPGCGKSLCAKVVAADWNMPLLRLDPGVLYDKFIGASESRLREALRQAEATAPVVLWIDEIEKAFASAGASSADGGLSQRMFGTLLSWMQDHRHPIFIVATANDISSLPPELMRKGRFDEVFFIDLPDIEAREQILAIHLGRKSRDASDFDVEQLAELSDGFTGSELEQAIVSALHTAFASRTNLKTEHIASALRETNPLSVLMGERIRSLRSWAEERCISAD